MALWLLACGLLELCTAVRPKLGSLELEEINDDRAQCLRRDNLDIAGGDETHYILRDYYSPVPANPQNDIYFLCEDLEIASLNADLQIRRVERNEFEFELGGDLPGENVRGRGVKGDTVGNATFKMQGFEVVTGMKIADWAADFAANRDVLRQGQSGSMTFRLSGRVRAVRKIGFWEAELVKGSEKVDHFELKIHRQWIIDRVLRSWGKLQQLIVEKLFSMMKEMIPINLLASFHYLPFRPGLPQERQDFWVEAKVSLKGGGEIGKSLRLRGNGQLQMYVKPAALLEVLMKNFNVKEMARDAVVNFFQDPETRKAFAESRETFAENLHQYRFVVSESLLTLVTEAEHLDELTPLLLNEAEERVSDLLLTLLDPLVKAHAAGTSGIFKNLKVAFGGHGGWKEGENNGLFEGNIYPWPPSEPFIAMNRSLLDAFGMGESLLEPVGNTQSCVTQVEGLILDIKSLQVKSGVVQNCRRSLDNKSAIGWEVRAAEFFNVFLRLPGLVKRTFAAACERLRVEFRSDGRVLFTSKYNGWNFTQKERSIKPKAYWRKRPGDASLLDGMVPAFFQRPTEASEDEDRTLLDRFRADMVAGQFSLNGTKEDTIALEVLVYQDAKIDLRTMVGDILAPRSRQDFGYIFTADVFAHYPGNAIISKMVMAILHCGFLRLFRWPLAKHGSDRLSTERLVDIDLAVVMTHGYSNLVEKDDEKGAYCYEVRFNIPRSEHWFWERTKESYHRLCGPHPAVMRLATGIAMQKVRFRDQRAEAWNYGSHEGKEQYLLRDGLVQRNLVQVMKDRWHAIVGDEDTPLATAALESNATQNSAREEPSSVLSLSQADPDEIVVPTRPGSLDAQKCRAEDLLNLHWPPERYGNAVLRKAFPTKALGNVYIIIERLQLVNLDVHGTLRRSDDTTFTLMLAGPDSGQAVVQLYLDGIDFAAPKSGVPGFVQHASVIDRVFRPMQSNAHVGEILSGGLQRGPLLVKFKMKVEFQMKNGHWEVKPGALSDVDITFGSGGVVEHMVNTLIDIFGHVDELLLESLWPMVVNYFPENLVQVLDEVSKRDGQLAHHFKILARCQKQLGDRCGSDRVDFFIKDLTNVDVAASLVLPMYLSKLAPSKTSIEGSLALTLLNSYVNCTSEHAGSGGPLEGMLGQVTVSLGMDQNTRAQVNVSTEALAPVKMLGCFLGEQVLAGLLPKERQQGRSEIKGAVKLHQRELNISKVRLQSLRFPFARNGKEDALELSATLNRAELVLNQPQGMVETLLGHVNLELDAAKGLVLHRIADGYPLLSMDLSPEFLQSFFQQVGDKWATPRNVRTGPEYHPDGKINEKYRRPRAQPAMSLDFQQLLVKAHTSVGVRFSERKQEPEHGEEPQEHLQALMSMVFEATFDMGQFFWRAVLNRKQQDYGFAYASTVGTWGPKAQGLPTKAAFLQISCGQVQVFGLPGIGPFEDELYSKEAHDIFMESADHPPVFEELQGKTCWKVKLTVQSWFQDPLYIFCSNALEMTKIQEALHLQMTRLAYIRSAQFAAQAADDESTRATGVRFTGKNEVFGDTTWFRRYNALDTSSWFPEIPAEYEEVQTPLQRWQMAVKKVS